MKGWRWREGWMEHPEASSAPHAPGEILLFQTQPTTVSGWLLQGQLGPRTDQEPALTSAAHIIGGDVPCHPLTAGSSSGSSAGGLGGVAGGGKEEIWNP